MLGNGCCGKKIRSYIDAYGTGYDFCRLYADENGAAVLVYNSLAVIAAESITEELKSFIYMLMPITVESDADFKPDKACGYSGIHRTLFRINPAVSEITDGEPEVNGSLDEIYGIISEGFGDIPYDLWYTDISHRIRHGVSKTYLLNKTTLTVQYDIGGFVFVSHVATASENRGKGAARRLLGYVAQEYSREGKTVYLYARDNRVSFYESFGCIPCGEDYLYQIEN